MSSTEEKGNVFTMSSTKDKGNFFTMSSTEDLGNVFNEFNRRPRQCFYNEFNSRPKQCFTRSSTALQYNNLCYTPLVQNASLLQFLKVQIFYHKYKTSSKELEGQNRF